ncbi:MAG: MFS transporter [Promethearchaeota archaeon]|jgi:GPH family glycoside/pentoside/hexuronide:cation symporter
MMNEEIDTQSVGRKIPRKQVAAYGVMYGSNNITNVARGLYLFAYLIDEFGLQLELYLLANLLFLGYNVLNNIVFSIYADKTRHKLGRRIPYIRYGALFLIITNVLIWFPWPGTFPGNANAGVTMKFIQYLVYLFVWDTVATIVNISFAAWIPEATESEKERVRMSVILRIATLFGGLSIIVIPIFWNSGLAAFRIFMIVGNTVNALCFFVGSFIIKERPELYKSSYKNASTKDILKQFIGLYQKKSFLSLTIFIFSTTMMMQFNNNYPVLIGYGLGFAEGGEYVVTFIFYAFSYGMIPILSRLVKSKPVDRIVLNIIRIGLALLAVFFILMIVSGFSWFLYPILAVGGAMLMVGLYGTLIGGNVIDQDELETGQRREALIGGASSLVLIPIGEIIGAIVAVGLIIINFEEGAGFAQTPSVLAGIRFLNFIIIFIAGMLTLISIKLYPFKGEALVKLKKDIMTLHAKKETDAQSNQESFSKS